jgi:hypothetical protein
MLIFFPFCISQGLPFPLVLPHFLHRRFGCPAFLLAFAIEFLYIVLGRHGLFALMGSYHASPNHRT